MKNLHYMFVLMFIFPAAGTVSAGQAILPTCISKHYGGIKIPADGIKLNAPDIAENGSVVSIGIDRIDSVPQGNYVREISFFNEFRKEPVARFMLSRKIKSENLKTRIRLRGSSNLYAVAVLDNGKVLGGKSHIKLTAEGCGGGGDARLVSDDLRICTDKQK